MFLLEKLYCWLFYGTTDPEGHFKQKERNRRINRRK
jgi:hypothetical protein